ncbi:MAG: EAL domain-containing protein [Cyanobacteria bacterium P01_H01_bin.15]
MEESVSKRKSASALVADSVSRSDYVDKSVDIQAYFILIGDDFQRVALLNQEVCRIGRHPICEISLNKDYLSRFHASIVRRTDQGHYSYWLIDGDLETHKPSSNGVFISRTKVHTHRLRHGQIINITKRIQALFLLLAPQETPSTLPEGTLDADGHYLGATHLYWATKAYNNTIGYEREHCSVIRLERSSMSPCHTTDPSYRLQNYLFSPLVRSLQDNLKYFYSHANHRLRRAREKKQFLAFVFLDLCFLDADNNAPLVDLSPELRLILHNCFRHLLPTTDEVIELGSDQFVIISNSLKTQGICERFIYQLRTKVTQGLSLRTSIFAKIEVNYGHALFPKTGIKLSALVESIRGQLQQRASKSLPQLAKSTLSNLNSAKTTHRPKTYLETQFIRAIKEQELYLHYQPAINLKEGCIAEVESFIRWRHPKLGVVLPSQFIPILDRSDLSMLLLDWTINKVCRQIQVWSSDGLFKSRITVNVSSAQLHHSSFLTIVSSALESSGIAPQLLGLEITSGTISFDLAASRQKIQFLMNLGVSLIIDDFKGHQLEFSLIEDLPISSLKIDKSVTQLDDSLVMVPLMSRIQDFGRTQDMVVTAEGVENSAQLQRLETLSLDQAQGYLFCRPGRAEQLAQYIVSHSF